MLQNFFYNNLKRSTLNVLYGYFRFNFQNRKLSLHMFFVWHPTRTVLLYGVCLTLFERSSVIGRPLVVMVTLCRWQLRGVIVVLAGVCIPLTGRTQAQVRFWDRGEITAAPNPRSPTQTANAGSSQSFAMVVMSALP